MSELVDRLRRKIDLLRELAMEGTNSITIRKSFAEDLVACLRVGLANPYIPDHLMFNEIDLADPSSARIPKRPEDLHGATIYGIRIYVEGAESKEKS
ncbi:hypothetical protein LCGC14_0427730 [marine sediment metagenome]|uniref:Uncharacterized protein n=1 Tax=marine sediment metagenome TaxID=412755 RepID=A0A0F9VYJ7_9ZZZZ